MLLFLFMAVAILLLWLVIKLLKYLLKSDEKSLPPAMHKPKEVTVQQTDTGYFPIKTGEKTIFVPRDKITFFYAKDNYVYVHDTEDHKYLTDYTLTDLEEKLPPQFVLIHRSYIVNKLLVKEIRKPSGSRFSLLLHGKKPQQLVSSQSYAPQVKELMKF